MRAQRPSRRAAASASPRRAAARVSRLARASSETAPQAPLAELPALVERQHRPGLPKYLALRDAVVEAVTSKRWSAGVRLPNETELSAALPLSLGTIQRALRILVEDGVIVRRQGQGTFVADGAAGAMHAPLHCRFVDDSGAGYLPVYPQVTARYLTEEDGPWRRHLGARELLCIERVLAIADEFKVFSRFYVDAVRLPAFATLSPKKLAAENFKEIIWRESGQPIGRIDQLLSTQPIPAAVATALGVRRGTFGQLLEISAFIGRDSPVYYQELVVPPNARRMHIVSEGRSAS